VALVGIDDYRRIPTVKPFMIITFYLTKKTYQQNSVPNDKSSLADFIIIIIMKQHSFILRCNDISTAGVKNTSAAKICLYGIFVVSLFCFFNVGTDCLALNNLMSWTRDALPLEQEEDSLQSTSASPSSSRLVPTQLVGTTKGYLPPEIDHHPEESSDLDWNDPIFQRNGWDDDPVVIEEYKLLFFTVPKNSCTEWKRLFRRMMNYSDWSLAYPHNPDSNGLRYLGQYKNSQQTEFMTSPNWTRAIFVREPMERLLSAFLDKAHGKERYILHHCCSNENMTEQLHLNNTAYQDQCEILHRLGEKGPLPTPQDFPFQTFVEAFMVQCKDPHWLPQSNRLKPTNWQHINFVGHFDTLEEDARSLLEKIGAWQDYGVTGWGIHGNLSIFQKNLARHSTSAKSQQDEFYTPQVLDRVLSYLKPDYDHILFNFTRPNMTTNML
jgi:hypothetical protein